VFFEHLGKCRRRLIANAGRNPGDGVVTRFEHECGLVHPTRDDVTVHRLADEPCKASREGRAAEPHMMPQRAKGPGMLGVFVDQLKRLAGVPIRNCTEPPTFAGTKGLNPTAQYLDKNTSVIRESTVSWPGRWTAASVTIRCRIVSSQSRSAAGLKCRTGGSNSSTLLGDGRDRLKRPQIIVENGFRPPP
jgi:hypothetical protein